MAEERRENGSGHQELSPKQRCATCALHWFAWIAISVYAVWHFSASEVNTSLPRTLSHVTAHWLMESPYFGVDRYWDLSDREWREGRQYLVSTWPWLLLHSVIGRVLTHVVPSVVPGYHAAYSLLFVSLTLGWHSAAFFVLEHAVFFALTWVGVPALCYVVAIMMVTHYDVFKYDFFQIVLETRGDHEYYVTAVSFYWTVLRCCSFCLDNIRRTADGAAPARGKRNHLADYFKTLAYAVYLPTLYLGPVQNYSDFATSMEKPKPSLTVRELGTLTTGLLRSGAHFLLMDLLCHYFYCAALIKAPYLVSELDVTSLVGLGAILNVMFYMKYRIQYGVSGGCARIEGHTLPAPPKCIARGHLCSHFWRYFDHGLHLWIKKYVYGPIVGSERKTPWRLLGIAAAFTCVWVWHSMTTAVTFWATLSFTGIALEVTMARIKRLDCVKSFEAKYLSPERTRIAKAILGSPHYLLTITACMFYLVDMKITTIFFKRVILEQRSNKPRIVTTMRLLIALAAYPALMTLLLIGLVAGNGLKDNCPNITCKTPERPFFKDFGEGLTILYIYNETSGLCENTLIEKGRNHTFQSFFVCVTTCQTAALTSQLFTGPTARNRDLQKMVGFPPYWLASQRLCLFMLVLETNKYHARVWSEAFSI
ncbi:protein-cysteine N-palmitoyltransferase HHAT isoform X3 [Rhipicephalus sanguineus]|uniref:protein-cysteine N-palmitoyltransferase HHAT isoform X3 n=1 Tax=Rhipicephalus sanguineus TaxID=34632 RepID=UPI0020C4FC72|nr:protein-cysteine N-palmitoyltransferase HHAT isoform X3 [Rhipicephalus sanguineus]